ncbi:hypothetical protein [Methylobacterium sp. D48H]
MPTYGWVREGDWDRFLAAIEWPPDPSGPRRRILACPHCNYTFETGRDLQAHVIDQHQVAPPVMVVAGREPREGQLIRVPLGPSDVVVANATTAEVQVDRRGWVQVPPEDVGRCLSTVARGTIGVRLVNSVVRGAAPAIRDYRVSLHIASIGELSAVEAAFQDHLTIDDIRSMSVSDFLNDPRCGAGGRDYAEGLAAYVLGVLVKEQSPDRVTTPLARYREHFNAALDRLSVHARPLPYLLCMLIRFALNTFAPGNTLTGYRELDLAMAILVGPGAPCPEPADDTSAALRRVCPVDHGTGRILDLASRLAREDRWGPVLRDECRQVAETLSLDIVDRQKATALWALAALRLGHTAEAAEPLARIAAVYPFASWARPCLDRMAS